MIILMMRLAWGALLEDPPQPSSFGISPSVLSRHARTECLAETHLHRALFFLF
jgi:cytochrome b